VGLTDLVETLGGDNALTDVRKVGIISDTHASSIDEIPAKFRDIIRGVDLIIHAGDFTGKMLLDELRSMGIPFRGVYGNMDPHRIRGILRAEEIIELQNIKIGIAHPSEGGPPWAVQRLLREKFPKIDAIIYGHTHIVENEIKDGVSYINPGSAIGKYPAPYPSISVLELLPVPKVIIYRT